MGISYKYRRKPICVNPQPLYSRLRATARPGKMQMLCRKGILVAILFAFLSVMSAPCLASDRDVGQRVDLLLSQGANEQAWQILQEFQGTKVSRVEILWRMARTQYEMGRLEESGDQAMAYFQEAEKYARSAIAEAPGKSDGYKWLAIAIGAQAKYTGTETRVRQSREIKENIEKAIALAPDDDIAYLVLSRWHYKISELSFVARTLANMLYGELPEASLKEAEDLLLRAIGIHDRIAHRYNLARVYDRMDRQKDAMIQYEKALLLPVTFPEEAEELAKARIRLQKLRDRARKAS
jgi:tetratricopeptide (TPR) repeat protein